MRRKREQVIKSVYANLVDGTSALLPPQQLETEFAKDRWDARNIPGLRYAPHRNNYYIRFEGVPEVFRFAVKDYAKFQVAADRSAKTLDQCADYLGRFFTFLSNVILMLLLFMIWGGRTLMTLSCISRQK